VTGTLTVNAGPPPPPGLPGETFVSITVTAPPPPPAPPLPTISPLLINSTPPGKAPLIVNAGVPVEVEDIVAPPLIVATTFEVWFQPFATARERKLTSVPVTVRLN
jgi:hypothetical protein